MSPESFDSKEQVFRGEVKKLFRAPSGRRLAETEVPGTGPVTFLLDRKVWDGEDDPVTGEEVLLTKLRLVRGKWRASVATRIRP